MPEDRAFLKKRRGHRDREATTQEPAPVHELTIPDELLAWGTDPVVARSFVRPWAHEVEKLVRQGAEDPLDGRATERLLARLEALCFEAIRAGRHELLLGFDLYTADWLGLVYEFEVDGRRGGFGRGQRWSYSELHTLAQANLDSGAARFVEDCKALIAGVFPQGRIGGILSTETPRRCPGCGCEDAVTWVAIESTEYCRSCYSDLVAPWPKIEGVNVPRVKKDKR